MDKFKDYSNIEVLLKDTQIPDMFKARQHFSKEKISDVAAETRNQLNAANLASLLSEGMSIAVTGSIRGIANMHIILREVVSFLKEHGTRPFIVPAMAVQQRKVRQKFSPATELRKNSAAAR